MTLPYQPIGYTPPCAAGLKVAAVLSIVAGGWTWVRLVGMEKQFYAYLIEVENGKYPANAFFFASTVNGVLSTVFWGAFSIALGIAMWRGKRAVRALVLANAAWVLLSGLMSLPWQFASVVESSQQVGISIKSELEAFGWQLIRLGIAAVAFWYFRSGAMKDTLNHYDPGLSWTERHPLVVFGAMFIAVTTGAFGLLDVAGFAFMALLGAGHGSVGLAAMALLHSILLFSATLACLKKPALGWWLFLASILFWFALQLTRASVMYAVMEPMSANWRSTGIQLGPWRWQNYIPTAAHAVVQLLVLWRWRSEFAGASPNSPTDKVAVPQ